MKALLITLVFFSSVVCAQDYSHQPHLGGDGSLDDSLVESGNYFEQENMRITSREQLEQRYKKETEEAMTDFEGIDD